MMVDPVIAADGHTYERTAMVDYLKHHHTSPVTGLALRDKRLVPNLNVKSAIAAHME